MKNECTERNEKVRNKKRREREEEKKNNNNLKSIFPSRHAIWKNWGLASGGQITIMGEELEHVHCYTAVHCLARSTPACMI